MNLQKDLALSIDTSIKLQECMQTKYLNKTELEMVTVLSEITLDALSYKDNGLDIFDNPRLLQSVFFGSLVSNKTFGTVVGLQLRSNTSFFNTFYEYISNLLKIKCLQCYICSNVVDLLHITPYIFMENNVIVCNQCRKYICH